MVSLCIFILFALFTDTRSVEVSGILRKMAQTLLRTVPEQPAKPKRTVSIEDRFDELPEREEPSHEIPDLHGSFWDSENEYCLKCADRCATDNGKRSDGSEYYNPLYDLGVFQGKSLPNKGSVYFMELFLAPFKTTKEAVRVVRLRSGIRFLTWYDTGFTFRVGSDFFNAAVSNLLEFLHLNEADKELPIWLDTTSVPNVMELIDNKEFQEFLACYSIASQEEQFEWIFECRQILCADPLSRFCPVANSFSRFQVPDGNEDFKEYRQLKGIAGDNVYADEYLMVKAAVNSQQVDQYVARMPKDSPYRLDLKMAKAQCIGEHEMQSLRELLEAPVPRIPLIPQFVGCYSFAHWIDGQSHAKQKHEVLEICRSILNRARERVNTAWPIENQLSLYNTCPVGKRCLNSCQNRCKAAEGYHVPSWITEKYSGGEIERGTPINLNSEMKYKDPRGDVYSWYKGLPEGWVDTISDNDPAWNTIRSRLGRLSYSILALAWNDEGIDEFAACEQANHEKWTTVFELKKICGTHLIAVENLARFLFPPEKFVQESVKSGIVDDLLQPLGEKKKSLVRFLDEQWIKYNASKSGAESPWGMNVAIFLACYALQIPKLPDCKFMLPAKYHTSIDGLSLYKK